MDRRRKPEPLRPGTTGPGLNLGAPGECGPVARGGPARIGAALLLSVAAFASTVSPVPAQEIDEEGARRGADPGLLSVLQAPVAGPVYTWKDGDETRRVHFQTNLVLRRGGRVEEQESQILKVGDTAIVRLASSSAVGAVQSDGVPVFRSESGALMALPGGVVLVLDRDRDWSGEQVEAFFAANGIALSRVKKMEFVDTAFLVETDPGFPSLELANALAGNEGVELSSPNWWTRLELK